MNAPALYDFSPALRMALLGLSIAVGPLAWWWLRHRGAQPAQRLRALTLITLFLTFDLTLFGAFTRLTDSGLGCPDWPGCYGNLSPLGAHHEITTAQTALPSGPVTHAKAWVEMLHRYLATGVGVLITVLMIGSWLAHRRDEHAISPWWATATFIGVCLQGAFGAWTVTLKLYPAIVTMHLLGAMALLMLLSAQSQAYVRAPVIVPAALRGWIVAVWALCIVQVALGGWVSTNYAVLACSEFPMCQGAWWPDMDFVHAFTVLRPLGVGHDGEAIPFAALTAIHLTHRIGAFVVFAAVGGLAWRLAVTPDHSARRFAWALGGVAAWQLASGLGNVVLGWPLVAALSHTGGAAMLLIVMTLLSTRVRQMPDQAVPAGAASPSWTSRHKAAS
ncbi:COX15/CtaA family protein [Piscinibacter terrae]|uniref:Heme A synthase n=1 Tax=Piscinibacter terrae TaxID=2496871 RepID=A0A3N7HHS9_9BURK|nr:COX15/CtaA family protein [Albitalea terrae]RQP21578.1 heme A synthase [Albitalea terrae]